MRSISLQTMFCDTDSYSDSIGGAGAIAEALAERSTDTEATITLEEPQLVDRGATVQCLFVVVPTTIDKPDAEAADLNFPLPDEGEYDGSELEQFIDALDVADVTAVEGEQVDSVRENGVYVPDIEVED